MGKGITLGPGKPVQQWLNAYQDGDVNRYKELQDWKNGDLGWVKSAPKA